MANDRMAEIVKLLLQKTRDGSVQWEMTPVGGQFQAPFTKYSVLLRGGPDTPYLMLNNERGEVVEDLSSITSVNLGVFDHLRELYVMARRQALGTDRALDEMLNILRTTSREK
jgi:hypothetical protein